MIPVTNPYNNYIGNGSTTKFDFDFFIENQSQLLVFITSANNTVRTLIPNTDYSVSGIKNKNGGYITYPLSETAEKLKSDETITLQLVLPITQQSEYGTSSEMDLENIEYSFDYLTRICQILNRRLERAAKIPEGCNTSVDELVKILTETADNLAEIKTVNAIASDITTVASSKKSLDTITSNINKIDTCADNIEAIKNADFSETEKNINKVQILDDSETHYPSCSAVTNELDKILKRTPCCFNSGHTDIDGDSDILYAKGVQTITSKWVQPILTQNGTLGNAELAVSALNANSGAANAWKLFDGSTTETSDTVSWQQPWTGNDKGFVIFSAKSIKIESLTVYQDSYCVGNFNLFGSLDGEIWTQIGSGLTFPHVQHATETCTVNSPEFYNYHKIIFTAGYNTSGGKDVIRTAEWKISAVYKEYGFSKKLTFKIDPTAVLSGTKATGETVSLTELPDINVSTLADGTYNLFVDESGTEVLKNTIFRQKATPSADLGDVWLNTAVEPIQIKKAYKNNFEVKNDFSGFKKVKELFHSTFDVSKFVVSGEPIIYANGKASGFSTGNFPRARVSLGSYNKWLLKGKIKTGEFIDQTALLANIDAPSLQIVFLNGHFCFSASSDGATWNISSGATSTDALKPETEYFIKIEFTGNSYIISASEDDETYKEFINVASTAKVYNVAYINIGTIRSANVFFNGEFDLKYFNIYGDGVLVFSGNETATDTVGSIQIPYTKTLSGEKIVESNSRNLVGQVATSNGSAAYYTIDEIQKTYTNPVGIIFSDYAKIPLGNFVVQSGLVKTYSTFPYNQNGYNVNAHTTPETTTSLEFNGLTTIYSNKTVNSAVVHYPKITGDNWCKLTDTTAIYVATEEAAGWQLTKQLPSLIEQLEFTCRVKIPTFTDTATWGQLLGHIGDFNNRFRAPSLCIRKELITSNLSANGTTWSGGQNVSVSYNAGDIVDLIFEFVKTGTNASKRYVKLGINGQTPETIGIYNDTIDHIYTPDKLGLFLAVKDPGYNVFSGEIYMPKTKLVVNNKTIIDCSK